MIYKILLHYRKFNFQKFFSFSKFSTIFFSFYFINKFPPEKTTFLKICTKEHFIFVFEFFFDFLKVILISHFCWNWTEKKRAQKSPKSSAKALKKVEIYSSLSWDEKFFFFLFLFFFITFRLRHSKWGESIVKIIIFHFPFYNSHSITATQLWFAYFSSIPPFFFIIIVHTISHFPLPRAIQYFFHSIQQNKLTTLFLLS